MARKKRKVISNLKIESIGAEGQGIAHHEGKVVFVEGGIPGDVADVEVLKQKASFAKARYADIHEYSPLRAEPFCIHFDHCGGCKWQHLQYEEQLQAKHRQVVDAFERIAKVEVGEIRPILASPETRYYRNKLEFTFSNKRWLTPKEIEEKGEITQREGLGFHIRGAFDKVLDIHECHLQPGLQNDIRNEVRKYALEHGLSFFDIREQHGLLRNLIVRNNLKGEWMVVLVVFEQDPAVQELLTHLQKQFPAIRSLWYIVNPKKNDSIHDLEPVHFWGEEVLIETLGHRQYRIGPKSFFQTNSHQAHNLYDVAREMARLQPTDRVYDLYTGAGTIALYLADTCQEVIGIEQIPEAVQDAEANAQLNGVANVRFWAGDTRHILTSDFITEYGAPDVLITDPPRAGMHEDVVRTIASAHPKRIVYVSCNPATQARDVALLKDRYDVKAIQPVDMFPHTYHVENVALLELR